MSINIYNIARGISELKNFVNYQYTPAIENLMQIAYTAKLNSDNVTDIIIHPNSYVITSIDEIKLDKVFSDNNKYFNFVLNDNIYNTVTINSVNISEIAKSFKNVVIPSFIVNDATKIIYRINKWADNAFSVHLDTPPTIYLLIQYNVLNYIGVSCLYNNNIILDDTDTPVNLTECTEVGSNALLYNNHSNWILPKLSFIPNRFLFYTPPVVMLPPLTISINTIDLSGTTTITVIPDSAFFNLKFNNLVLPNTIKYIHINAFKNVSIQNLTIPFYVQIEDESCNFKGIINLYLLEGQQENITKNNTLWLKHKSSGYQGGQIPSAYINPDGILYESLVKEYIDVKDIKN